MSYAYYVYYRVDPDKAEECESKIRQLLEAMKEATGVAGRLMKKRGEPFLWMEVYENVDDEARFEWELADAAGRLKIQDYLQHNTSRHVECFKI